MLNIDGVTTIITTDDGMVDEDSLYILLKNGRNLYEMKAILANLDGLVNEELIKKAANGLAQFMNNWCNIDLGNMCSKCPLTSSDDVCLAKRWMSEHHDIIENEGE